MNAKRWARRVLTRAGMDVVRYRPTSHPLARRKRLLDAYSIDLVLDVGANIGQYGNQLRDLGYRGEIISFEPLNTAYRTLHATAKADGGWQAMNYALGNTNRQQQINVAGNSFSSSILEMLPAHKKAAPHSEYIGVEVIEVRTLDAVFEDLGSEGRNILLKVDTQGYEKQVLDGAEEALPYIDTLQLELSLTPLYSDALLFADMVGVLSQKGYRLISIEPEFIDPDSGEMLQVEGTFRRACASQ